MVFIYNLYFLPASCEEQVHPTRRHMKVFVSTFSDDDEASRFGMKLYPTGSNLPDCSHACGPCIPCKRVMVSFKCSIESCPVIYKCVCKGKYYHVPSP